MRDIKINTPLLKFLYYVSWIGFVIGFLPICILFIILYNYGWVTNEDIESRKLYLNKTWQKFAFFYGSYIFWGMLVLLVKDFIFSL